jgi:hypothetical protein
MYGRKVSDKPKGYIKADVQQKRTRTIEGKTTDVGGRRFCEHFTMQKLQIDFGESRRTVDKCKGAKAGLGL